MTIFIWAFEKKSIEYRKQMCYFELLVLSLFSITVCCELPNHDRAMLNFAFQM